MARVRVELDSDGMEALLKSGPVLDSLENVADDVAAKATAGDPNHETGPITYHVRTKVGRERALAWVSSEHVIGAALERKYAPLRRAALGVADGGED